MVETASTMAQARSWRRKLHPDVVLVDIDLGGEDALSWPINSNEKAGVDSTRVILVSAYAKEITPS